MAKKRGEVSTEEAGIGIVGIAKLARRLAAELGKPPDHEFLKQLDTRYGAEYVATCDGKGFQRIAVRPYQRWEASQGDGPLSALIDRAALAAEQIERKLRADPRVRALKKKLDAIPDWPQDHERWGRFLNGLPIDGDATELAVQLAKENPLLEPGDAYNFLIWSVEGVPYFHSVALETEVSIGRRARIGGSPRPVALGVTVAADEWVSENYRKAVTDELAQEGAARPHGSINRRSVALLRFARPLMEADVPLDQITRAWNDEYRRLPGWQFRKPFRLKLTYDRAAGALAKRDMKRKLHHFNEFGELEIITVKDGRAAVGKRLTIPARAIDEAAFWHVVRDTAAGRRTRLVTKTTRVFVEGDNGTDGPPLVREYVSWEDVE